MILNKVSKITLGRDNAIFAAQIMDSFARILASEVRAADVLSFNPSTPAALPERCGVGCDYALSGMLFLSVQVANCLSRVVDWNAWDNGVFSYEHLDAVGDGGTPARIDPSLPAFLYHKITDEQWHDIFANHRLPDDACLDQLIHEWAKSLASIPGAVQPPLHPASEKGLSKEQLAAKYPGEEGHPNYPLMTWRRHVMNYQTRHGYWDWVANEIAGQEVRSDLGACLASGGAYVAAQKDQ